MPDLRSVVGLLVAVEGWARWGVGVLAVGDGVDVGPVRVVDRMGPHESGVVDDVVDRRLSQEMPFGQVRQKFIGTGLASRELLTSTSGQPVGGRALGGPASDGGSGVDLR